MPYLSFFIALIVLVVVLKLISLPFKLIIKLVINALIGGIILYVINLIGAQFGFTLDITWITSLIVGLLGIPGVIIVVILQFFV